MKSETRDKIFVGIGIFGLVGFLYLYFLKLFGWPGKPPTMAFIENYVGIYGLIMLNILIFASFLALLPYRHVSKSRHWKSKGAFVGFLIALFTEMFGLPLIIFLFSPFFTYPFIVPLSRELLGGFGMIVGTWLVLVGVVLVFLGWKKIHRAEGLITDGIYRYIRHPQYTGFFLIIFGWILHWPTLLGLIFFPILIVTYYWLARKEESQLKEIFSTDYIEYKKQTPAFFPRLL
jgi:protein-S-isoprenylcysteine O-methyltransferase Ste14